MKTEPKLEEFKRKNKFSTRKLSNYQNCVLSFYLFRCIKCYHVDIHWLTPFQQQPQSDEAPAVKLLLRPLSAHSICLKKKYIYVSVYVLFPSQNSKIQCFQGSTLLSGIKINNLNESHINHQGDDAWREKGKKLHRFFLNLSCIKVETLWPFFSSETTRKLKIIALSI